jgi:hypothetical protein
MAELTPARLAARRDPRRPSTGQLVLREIVDRFYRGVFLAPRDQVRLAGSEFEARQ